MCHDGTRFDRLLAWRKEYHLPRGVASVPVDIGYTDAPAVAVQMGFVALPMEMLTKLFSDRGDVLVGIHGEYLPYR
jgi:hypothetical protein